MKTFKDLEFNNHQNFAEVLIAKLVFKNGYGVSVVTGIGLCTDEKNRYEVVVSKNNEPCFDTHIADYYVEYCNKATVTKIMKQIQELEKPKNNGSKSNNSKAKIKT